MKKLLCLSFCLVLLLSAAACGKTGKTGNPNEIKLKDEALRSDFVCEDNYRVFYEIFVGSFSDSDGDGVGPCSLPLPPQTVKDVSSP